MALVAGLALGASLVLPSVPREQELVLRIGSSREIRALELGLTREGEREPAIGARLTFPGRAPPSIRHKVSLPNGVYVVSVELDGDDPLKETRYVRRVTLQGGETVLPLEDAP